MAHKRWSRRSRFSSLRAVEPSTSLSSEVVKQGSSEAVTW